MNRTWYGVRQFRRTGYLVWRNGPIILLPVLFFAISVALWRPLLADAAQTVATQVDYEDAVLCTKFGFAAGTPALAACKLDLLDLRHGHEQLLAAASYP